MKRVLLSFLVPLVLCALNAQLCAAEPVSDQQKAKDCGLRHGVVDNDLLVIECMIKSGANVNHKSSLGRTMLLIASCKGSLGSVRLLLQNGADPNLQDADGFTPLMMACEGGFLDVLLEFLKYGANQNIQDSNGRTALQRAARFGHCDVVRELLASGADPDIKDARGVAALHLAVVLQHVAIVKELLAGGANRNIPADNFGGLTPLRIAYKLKNEEIIVALLMHSR